MTEFQTERTLAVVFAALLVAFTGVTASLQANFATAQQDTAIALEEGHKKMEDKIKTKDKDIPVVVTGVVTLDGKQFLLVVIDEKKADKSEAVYEDKIKAEVGDIPLKVGFGKFETADCTSKTAECTMPMVGGVRVNMQNQSGFNKFSTMAIAAERTTGADGFLVTAHTVGWDNTGGDVGQSTSSRKVGDVTVNPSGGASHTRTSDAAWADLDSGMSISVDTLFRTGTGGVYTIDECLGKNEIAGNEEVRLHGYTRSGLLSGFIIGTNISGAHPDGTLTGQYITSGAVPVHGDSGGALTSPPSNNVVDFYGMAVGTVTVSGTEYGLYSPWNAIQSELGLNDC